MNLARQHKAQSAPGRWVAFPDPNGSPSESSRPEAVLLSCHEICGALGAAAGPRRPYSGGSTYIEIGLTRPYGQQRTAGVRARFLGCRDERNFVGVTSWGGEQPHNLIQFRYGGWVDTSALCWGGDRLQGTLQPAKTRPAAYSTQLSTHEG